MAVKSICVALVIGAGLLGVALYLPAAEALPVQVNTNPAVSTLNITTTTVVRSGSGFIFTACTGAQASTVFDSNIPTGNTAANTIATIPMATCVALNFPYINGILVTGAGPLSISYL